MDSLSLLQGIFPTQGSNPGLQHCWQILYGLRHHTNPANALQDPCTWRSILLQCSDLSAAPGISQAPPTSKPWHPQTCDTSCLDDPLHTLPKGLCLDLISSEAPSLTTPIFPTHFYFLCKTVCEGREMDEPRLLGGSCSGGSQGPICLGQEPPHPSSSSA